MTAAALPDGSQLRAAPSLALIAHTSANGKRPTP